MKQLSNIGLLVAVYKYMKGKRLSLLERATLDFYSSNIANILSRGRLPVNRNIPKNELLIGYNALSSTKGTHHIYCVTSVPGDHKGDVLTTVRRALLNEESRLRVFTQTLSLPMQPDMKRFDAEYATQEGRLEDISADFDRLSASQKKKGVRYGSGKLDETVVNNAIYSRNSYRTVEREQANGALTASYMLVHIYKNVDDNDIDVQSIANTVLSKLGLSAVEVTAVRNYMTELSPFGYPTGVNSDLKNIRALFVPLDTLLCDLDLTQGIEGNRGAILGYLTNNTSPVAIDQINSSDVAVNLVLGQAGSGKSVFLKNSVEEYIENPRVYQDISDAKGTEYIYLKQLYPQLVEVVDLDANININTYDVSAIPNADRNTILECIDFSTRLWLIRLDLTEKDMDYYKDISRLIKSTMLLKYKSILDLDDPSTYSKSKSITDEGMWSTFLDTTTNSSDLRANYPEAISITKKGMTAYLDSKSDENVGESLALGDILYSQVVIYCLHRQHKEDDNLNVAQSYLYMSFLSNMRNKLIKKSGCTQVQYFEEVQEIIKNLAFAEYLAKCCTVSRSNNVIIFIAMNNLQAFADSGMTVLDKAVSSILAQVSCAFVGYMVNDNVELLKSKFGSVKFNEMLSIVLDESAVIRNKYKLAFFYKAGDVAGAGVLKTLLPTKYMENPLYMTRDSS